MRDRSATQYADNKDYHYCHHLHRKLGITMEQAAHLARQRTCEVCGAEGPGGRRLSVDHNHSTDRVRGAVCQRCNLLVAALEADPVLLAAIRAYLDRYA